MYEANDFSRYWEEPNRHPFVIRIDGELGGFVLVNKVGSSPDVDWNMGEFFIVAKFQGKGIGHQIAIKIIEKFKGIWEVTQMPLNKAAISFWKKVIEDYTGGQYSESRETILEPETHDIIILRFQTQ